MINSTMCWKCNFKICEIILANNIVICCFEKGSSKIIVKCYLVIFLEIFGFCLVLIVSRILPNMLVINLESILESWCINNKILGLKPSLIECYQIALWVNSLFEFFWLECFYWRCWLYSRNRLFILIIKEMY